MCQNCTFKVNFLCQKPKGFFFFIISFSFLKEYQFRRPFLIKNFFFQLQSSDILFSKIMPNFCQPGTKSIHKTQQFPCIRFIFSQKSCFLGPPKVETT